MISSNLREFRPSRPLTLRPSWCLFALFDPHPGSLAASLRLPVWAAGDDYAPRTKNPRQKLPTEIKYKYTKASSSSDFDFSLFSVALLVAGVGGIVPQEQVYL